MKLLNIKIDKAERITGGMLIRQILAKYPDADLDSIYGTMLKNGREVSYGTIRSARSDFNRGVKVKKLMGVK